jgi:transglutaminase-like putative cysteine protease
VTTASHRLSTLTGLALCCSLVLAVVPASAVEGPAGRDVDEALAEVLSLRDARAVVPLLSIFRSWDLADPDRIETAFEVVAGAARVSVPVRSYARWLGVVARLRRADAGAARRGVEALGFARDYLVIGPFDNEGKAGLAREDPPEAARRGPIDLAQGVPGREREVLWRPVPSDAVAMGTLNLDSLLRPNVNVCALAQTFVTSEREQRVTLLAGGGGGLKVYLNGSVVLEDAVYRSVDPDRRAVAVTLARGTNRVLLKSCVSEGAWGVTLRLAGPDGLAVPGLTWSADPAAAGSIAPTVAPRPTPVDWILGALEARARGDRAPAAALLSLARYLRWTGGDDPDVRDARRLAMRAVELLSAGPSRGARPSPDPRLEALLFAAEVAEDRNERGRMLARAQALASAEPDVLAALATFRRTGPRPEEALVLASRALAIEPRLLPARLERAGVFGEAGLPMLARAEIAAGLALEPVAPPALLRAAADWADAAGLPDEALAMRRAYLRAFATDTGAARTVAGELALRGAEDAARRTAELALALRPDASESYVFAAEVLESVGDPEAAERTYQRLEALAPEDALCLQAHGRFLARASRSAEAVALFRRALVFRPQDADLRQYLEHLEPADRPERPFLLDAERLRAGPRQPDSGGYSARYLQDLTVNVVYDNGLGSSFKQVVIEVLTEEGARRYQQYSIQYDPSGQRVDVRLARVLRRGGAVDQAVQRYDQSLSEPWYSLYYDFRADVVVFPRLQPGDVIELQYAVDDVAHRNLFADYYGDITFMQNVEPRQHVGYVLVSPGARSFYFQEPRLPNLQKRVQRQGETRVYSFLAENVPAVAVEEQMPGFAEVAAYVHVSTYQSWQDVGHWYWGLVREQFQADAALQATVRRVTSGIEEPRAKARAIYDWVVRNTRYVGLEFGIHGFKPYRTSQVVSRGFGDCKDKATLLVVMLQEAGVPATIVLVRTRRNGEIAPFPASLAVFDHAIAYVPSLDLYLDGTAEHSGSTELPAQDQGVTVLVVNQGNAVLTHTPVFPAEQNRRNRSVTARVLPDGSAVVTAEETIEGSGAASFRDRYEAEGTRGERVEQSVGAVYPGADVESFRFTSLEDLEQPVRFEIRAHVPQYARVEAGGLSLPVAPEAQLVRTLARTSERRQDIDLGGKWEVVEHLTTELPASLRTAALPQAAHIESDFGRLDLTVELAGRNLVVHKRLSLRRDRVARSEYGRFREFCRAVDAALEQRVMLVRP